VATGNGNRCKRFWNGLLASFFSKTSAAEISRAGG